MRQGKKRHSVWRLFGVALVLLLAASACGGDDGADTTTTTTAATTTTSAATDTTSGASDTTAAQATTTTAPSNLAENQVATFAISNMPQSLDPHQVLSGSPRRFDIYEALLDLHPQTADLRPMLATEWEVVDATTYRMTLRDDAVFHNGDAFSASDVVFSLDRARSEGRATASLLTNLDAVEVVDDHHIVITTTQPDALFLKKLARVGMLPEAYYTGLGSTTEERDEAFASAPVGTGPYELSSFEPGRVVVTKADTTWRTPILDEVTVLQIPDPSAQVAAFLSGQAQYINRAPLNALEDLEEASANIIIFRNGNDLGAFMDTVDSQTGEPKQGPMGERVVREAINQAIDRDTLVNDVLLGLTGTDGGQLAAPGAYGYNPNITDPPYDPENAERLLDEAGYPRGSDGVRFSITMKSAFAGPGSERRLIGEFVANQLEQVGIEVDYEALTDVGSAVDMFYGRAPRPDIYHFGLFTRPYLDPAGAYNWFQTSNPANHYSNETFDELYDQQEAELDPDAREKLIWEMNEIFREDAPWLFLTEDLWIDVAAAELGGVIRSEVQTEQYFDLLFITNT